MGKPFLHLKTTSKGNLKKVGLILVTSMSIASLIYGSASNQTNSNKILQPKAKSFEEVCKVDVIEVDNTVIDNKAKETKKLALTKLIITNFIMDKNPKLSREVAEVYTQKIMNVSIKRNISPYVQASLIASESNFISNPKHDIDSVIGMGAVYSDIWLEPLKKEGIIQSKNDLKNPYISIEASSYIVALYMKASNYRHFTAIAKYKGFCKLGKKQAQYVMSIANNLKQQEKNLKS